MTVSVQVPYTSSIANGVSVVYPYQFTVLDEDDIEVSLDGVPVSSGFTLTGVGNAAGGDVVFSVAPAAGVVVLRALKPVLERKTDYQQFGDLPTPQVNRDFDRLWLALSSLAQNLKRALKLPFDTPVDQEIIEDATVRANKALRFDASGNLQLSSYDPDAASAAAASAVAAAADAVSAAAAITGFERRGAWATATAYVKNNLALFSGSTYIALSDHTSGASFATDLGDGKWEVFAAAGASGSGIGDLLAANNLSELTASAATARANLGLGSVAVKSTGGTNSGDVPTNADVRGKQTIGIPAAALRPRQTGGCAALVVEAGAAGKPDVPYLEFDASTPQYAGFVVQMPKSWNKGTLTASFCWRRASGADATNCVWGMRAVAVQDNGSPAVSFGAEATVTDDAKTATENFALSDETAACTVSGTITDKNLVFVEFFRKADAAGDTLASKAKLTAISLHYSTGTNTDA